MTIERKVLTLVEAKAAPSGDGPGTIEGYASVFGGVDSYGDTIDPGAYAETIPRFLHDGFVAWGHDWSSPVATPTAALEDGKGLYVSAEFHTTPEAQQARLITTERLARGKSMGLSIGYEAQAWEMRTVETPYRNMFGELTDQVRALTKIKLFEFSLVTVPADSAALVTGAKGYGLTYDEHSERVRVAVSELLDRSRAGSALRVKEGRAISAARRARMESVMVSLRQGADEIEAMLQETMPPKSADRVTETLRLRTETDRLRSRLRALGIQTIGVSA